MDDKNFFELTPAQIAKRSKLTRKERRAVSRLLSAVRALPNTLCVDVEDASDSQPREHNFLVFKRITRGSSQEVASIRKKSLTLSGYL